MSTESSQIEDATKSIHRRLLVYGEPGIKKTRDIVGTTPGKVLVIRPPTDHLNAVRPNDLSRIKQWVMRDWDDMDRAEDYLRSEKGETWDFVWLDSASLLQDYLLDDELETEINEISKNPKRALWGPDQGVYGRNMFKIAAWVRHVVGPDTFNFGIICHTSTEPLPSPDQDDEGDPIDKMMPWIQGRNMSPKICGYMNAVYLMAKNKEGRTFLRTSSNQYFYAKDQFHIAPNGVLWDPTTPKILSLIDGKTGQAPKSKTAGARRPAARRRVVKRGG